jgi:hypothetical protein
LFDWSVVVEKYVGGGAGGVEGEPEADGAG